MPKTTASFNPDEYTTVAERIALFYQAYPNGRIHTRLVSYHDGRVIVEASVFRWGQALVTTEQPGTSLARVATVYRRSLKTFADSVRHHEGGVDKFTYDESRGLLVSRQMAGQATITMRYGANAQVDSVWGTGTPAQRIFIGLRGRTDSVRVAGAYTTRYTYDIRDRMASAKDPSSHTTYLYYESIFGNRDSTKAPGNRATKAKFDGMGRDTAARAGALPWQVTTYDQVNRTQKKILATTSQPDTTIYTFDNLYLTQVRDAAGNAYGFAYNPLGQVTQRTDPASNPDKYFYDAEGLATTWVNRRSDTLKTTYDALHRRLTKSGNLAVADSFFYAADGRWSAAHNKYSRDTAFTASTGWTDSVVTRLATDWTKRLRVSYTPSSVWQLDSVGVSSNTGIAFVARRYFWSALKGTLDSVAFNGQKVSIGYDAELMPSSVTQPGGVTRSQSVTSIHDLFQAGYNTIGIDTLLWRSTKYDALGRMSEQYALAQSSTNKTHYVYKYDERGRLVAVHDSTLYYANRCDSSDPDIGGRLCDGYTASFQWRDSLAYDRVGNIAYTEGTAATGFPVHDKNRIVSWPGFTFTRDSAGNVASRTRTASGVITNYHWSADGLLDSVAVGTRVIQYDYNAFGQLVRKRVNGTVQRHFLWDQGHLFAELDGALGSRVAEYAYYPGTDRPLAIMTGATAVTKTAYYHQDAQGNVIGLVTSAGAVDGAAIVTKPWGEFEAWLTGLATADTNRLRWKGLVYEGDSTQLYYVRARWYDPETHRFLTQDPLGLEGGVNPYAFAGNDPVNQRDPSGMFMTDSRGVCGGPWAGSCGSSKWDDLELMLETGSRQGGNVQLGCRPIRDPTIGRFAEHCAISFTIDGVTYFAELVEGPDGRNLITVVERIAIPDSYWNSYTWVNTSYANALKIYASALRNQDQHLVSEYTSAGSGNSNHWVWEIYEEAGSLLHWSSVDAATTKYYVPGICGGVRFRPLHTGTRCSP